MLEERQSSEKPLPGHRERGNESYTTDLLSSRSFVSLHVPALRSRYQRHHHHDPLRAGEAPDARAARPDARTREPPCPRYEPTYTHV
jgi:hypothetical protein